LIDQVILYDQALITWINNTLPPLLKGRTTQLLVATARKAYAEATTGQVAENETLTFPRIALTKTGKINNPSRFNSNRVRRLGWCDDTKRSRIRSARFPAPMDITYQVDLWTRFVSEMNIWEQQLMLEFAPQHIVLDVRIDDVWQEKLYSVFLEGDIGDTSDLEPAEGERAIRRTMSLRAEAWVFDQNYVAPGIVKAFEFRWLDYDDYPAETEFDRTFLPPVEKIGEGDGNQTAFGPLTVERPPVLENTVIISTVIGGTGEHVQDDSNGNLYGDRVASGTINYTTGEISITFTAAPDAGEDINITYFTDLS
jgi:hypothetical protein